MASGDDDGRRVLTRKELAKAQRHAAYERAKARRASDPRYLAMKQAAKEQRRAAYQKLKQARKAETTANKVAIKEQRAAERDAELAQQLANNQRTAQHAERLAAPPHQAAAAIDASQPFIQDASADAASIADRDESLWKYVNWATPKRTVN